MKPILLSDFSAASLLASLLASVFLAGLALPAAGQSAAPAQLTPEQRETIKDRLTGMLTDLGAVTIKKNSSLTETFLKASESERTALAFFLESIEDVDFKRAGRTGTEFRDWKDANEQTFDNKDFAKALQILLRYLAISTEAARTDDMKTVFPLLSNYIDAISAMEEIPYGGGGAGGGGGGAAGGGGVGRGGRYGERGGRAGGGGGGGVSVLEEPIYDSIFARRYDLFEELRRRDRQDRDAEEEDRNTETKNATWESRPLNVGGMYEKTILPYLFAHSLEKVLPAWTKRIEQESRMSEVRGDAAEENFRRLELPELQWDMAKDQFKVGDEVQGAARMLELIDANKSTHPEVSDWIKEAIALIFPATDSTYRKDG